MSIKAKIIKKALKVLIDEYGFEKSVEKNLPIDRNENPLPLYTYPAIEYLKSLNFKNKKIFEFGSGNSTLFWLNKGAKVTSIEDNEIWFKNLTQEIDSNKNHKFIFAQGKEYINYILKIDTKYDVIIIDGSQNRFECTKVAINKIKKDGIIIIDNSDWFENSTKLVRDELDFLQIDFYGFRPSKPNTSVTSFFFSRESKLQSISKKQPSFAIGGLEKHSKNDSDNSK